MFKHPQSQQVYDYLAEVARNQKITTYKPVGTIVELEPSSQLLWSILGDCSEHSHREHGVMVSVVVVGFDRGYPGGDFFGLARDLGFKFKDPVEFWAKHLRKVHETYAQLGSLTR